MSDDFNSTSNLLKKKKQQNNKKGALSSQEIKWAYHCQIQSPIKFRLVANKGLKMSPDKADFILVWNTEHFTTAYIKHGYRNPVSKIYKILGVLHHLKLKYVFKLIFRLFRWHW